MAVLGLRYCTGFSPVAASGGRCSWLWCVGVSLRWPPLLPSIGSRHSGLSSCSMQPLEQGLLLLGMWDIPGPGMEPVSPALQGTFLTTGLLGKPDGPL